MVTYWQFIKYCWIFDIGLNNQITCMYFCCTWTFSTYIVHWDIFLWILLKCTVFRKCYKKQKSAEHMHLWWQYDSIGICISGISFSTFFVLSNESSYSDPGKKRFRHTLHLFVIDDSEELSVLPPFSPRILSQINGIVNLFSYKNKFNRA